MENHDHRDFLRLAEHADEIRPLQALCRNGRVYEVEAWIAEGKPLQLAPNPALKGGAVPKSALTIAIETGQHSLATLLLKSGYQLSLERRSPLGLAIQVRQWGLVDLLIEHGADLGSVYDFIVLGSYNTKLYERFWAAGYDLADGLADALSESTSNRPLFGFAKRHRHESPNIQHALNIALANHARAGIKKGVSLCLWAGADPHARTPDPTFGLAEDVAPEDRDDYLGPSAVQEAASGGDLDILRKLAPDPDRDDFDSLYQSARNEGVVALLLPLRPPKNLTAILSWHIRWLADPLLALGRIGGGVGTITALLKSGVIWSESDPRRIADIRRELLRARDWDLKEILSLMRKSDVCAQATYRELMRTARMQERAIAVGVEKKPVSEREERRAEIARLSARYDRTALYDQVWSQPVQHVALSYGISGVALAKACRKLRIPVPPRGYWARVRNGEKIKKPLLPKLA